MRVRSSFRSLRWCRLSALPVWIAVVLTTTLLTGVTGLAGPVKASALSAPVRSAGYIEMRDGARLKYSLALPEADGRFPVALVYDGYNESAGAEQGNDPDLASALLEAGFAVLGVNVRGTGCSSGQFDFRHPRESRDGAEVVEWAARQAWSTGRVGMFGDSYPGLTQPGVAALQPQGLAAIAPFQIVDDVYRDVGYPGGILNVEFAAFWALLNQPASAQSASVAGVASGDPDCLVHDLESAPGNAGTNVFVSGIQHPYRDEVWRSKAIGKAARAIKVPVLGCVTWQDDEVGSLSATTFFDQLPRRQLWMIASNGYHGMCDRSGKLIIDQTVAFFERFVAGRRNGFESTPRVQLFHEAQNPTNLRPRWISTYGAWPPAHRVRTLSLTPAGALVDRPPRRGGQVSYRYPAVSAGTESGLVFGQRGLLWRQPFDTAGSAVFTTAVLSKAMEVFGPSSLDLWFASTATDTDLQATLTEVRPDGQEVYVARGWLRASHRATDRRASSRLLPVHTHREADASPLEAGVPTRLRVGIFPVNHVFRAGSRLRLIIDTPSQTGGWGFDAIDVPATNTVLTGNRHPSRLRLGVLASPRAIPGYPACGNVLNQPCRPDPFD